MNRTFCLFLSLTLAVTFCMFMESDACGQAKMFAEKEMRAFAQTSLQGYVNDVLTENNAGKYGFKTVGEARQAALGEPLPVNSIELKDLKAYRPGAGLKSIPTDSRATWYPVLVNNAVQAKLEIVESAGKLLAGGFGAASEARRISSARQQIPDRLRAKGIQAAGAMSIVKIPALKATFICVESVGGNFLVPAMASPQRFDLKGGELYPADELLLKLREQVKDLPDDLVG